MTYSLFTFKSTHDAISAERILHEFKPVMMPTLREITTGCGISLKIKFEDSKTAVDALKNSDIIDNDDFELYTVNETDDFQKCKRIF